MFKIFQNKTIAGDVMIDLFCRTRCGRVPRRVLDIIFRHSVKGKNRSNQDNREFHPQAVVGSWPCEHLHIILNILSHYITL